MGSDKAGQVELTSMVQSKFLQHQHELGVVAVGFSGGQVSSPPSPADGLPETKVQKLTTCENA